jgi:DNA-binding winged helix-turn-helix (wHTH) protein
MVGGRGMARGTVRSDSVIHFGVVEVDTALRQVRHDGVPVPVEPKPFEVLLYLIHHCDRVVRREELMEALWPGVVVSEATLSSAVRRVRDVIGPERERIQVVRKVGYRFLARPNDWKRVEGESRPSPQRDVAADRAADDTDLFIGRTVEMKQLSEYLDEALLGRGRFVALSGEPGSGKSRTIGELARMARNRGAEVLLGRCYEGEGGQVLWPWVQVFRSFSAARSDAELTAILGAEAVDIARLTPAVTVPESEPSSNDPAVQRARLLDSVVTVLRRAAGRRPLVIAFDDLHWADSATIMLLRALIDQIGDAAIAAIGTYRNLEIDAAHPLAAMLAALRSTRALREVVLGNFSHAEVAALLRTLAGTAVEPAVAAAVFCATEGHPLFAREYWYDLAERGSVIRREQGWTWGAANPQLSIPATVSEIIRWRLQRLPTETGQLLAIAAVVGREFHHEVISRVIPSPASDVIGLLERAMEAGVIEEIGDGTGSYRFSHALVRETLYEGLTGLRRAALHRAVGEAIEASAGLTPSPRHVAELAHHFLAAVPAGSIEAAVRYARRAAAEATRACAYDDAVRYLERAVRACELRLASSDAPDPAQRCELQLQLAEALYRAGEGAAMRAIFEDAAGRARAIAAPRLFARAAIGVTSRWLPEDGSAVRLLEEALSMLAADDLALRARTKARLAKTLYLFADSRARREQLCAEAQAAATQSGDPHALAEVLADSLEALFHSDSLPQQDRLAAALHEAATAAGDASLLLLSGAWQIVNAMRSGRLCEADRRLLEFSRLAEDLRQPRFLHHAAAFDAALLMARGRLQESERRMEEALALGLRIDEASARWLHWGQLSHLRREQGRLEELLDSGLKLRLPPDTPAALFYERSYRWATPHVFSELGREDEARASFAALMAQGLDGLPAENARNTRISALLSLGDACATIGDEGHAALLGEALLPYADQWQVVGWGSAVFASVRTMLGALTALQKKWPAAEEHFEEALAQHDRENAVCAQARTLFQYARAVQRRGRRTDVSRARELIRRGLELAHDHRLDGIAARLQRLASARKPQ